MLLKTYSYTHKARALKCWINSLGKTNHITDEDQTMFKIKLSLILPMIQFKEKMKNLFYTHILLQSIQLQDALNF